MKILAYMIISAVPINLAFAQLPNAYSAFNFGWSITKMKNNLTYDGYGTPGPEMNDTWGTFHMSLDTRADGISSSIRFTPLYADLIAALMWKKELNQNPTGWSTGGFVGNSFFGIDVNKSDKILLSFGPSVGGYQILTSTADLGAHFTIGAAANIDVCTGKESFARVTAKYDIPWWHFIPPSSVPGNEIEDAKSEKNAHWVALNLNFFHKKRLNAGVDIWKPIVRNGSGLNASRMTFYVAFTVMQISDRWRFEK